MLLATALALLITGCAQQTFTVQNKPAAVAPRKPSPIDFLRFDWAEENCRCSQNLWRRRNVVKTETQQTFVNGLLSFFTLLWAFILRWKRVCMLTIIAWVTWYGQLYLHCSLIYFWVPSSCFAQVISPSLREWNNPVQRCLPVGGGWIIHAGALIQLHWLTDCFDIKQNDDQRQHHHAEHHFQL